MEDHSKGTLSERFSWYKIFHADLCSTGKDIFIQKSPSDRQKEQVDFLLKNVKNQADYNDHEINYIRRVFNHTITKLRASNPNYVEKLIRTVSKAEK